MGLLIAGFMAELQRLQEFSFFSIADNIICRGDSLDRDRIPIAISCSSLISSHPPHPAHPPPPCPKQGLFTNISVSARSPLQGLWFTP